MADEIWYIFILSTLVLDIAAEQKATAKPELLLISTSHQGIEFVDIHDQSVQFNLYTDRMITYHLRSCTCRKCDHETRASTQLHRPQRYLHWLTNPMTHALNNFAVFDLNLVNCRKCDKNETRDTGQFHRSPWYFISVIKLVYTHNSAEYLQCFVGLIKTILQFHSRKKCQHGTRSRGTTEQHRTHRYFKLWAEVVYISIWMSSFCYDSDFRCR